jgi:hypothetical protein
MPGSPTIVVEEKMERKGGSVKGAEYKLEVEATAHPPSLTLPDH